ncbi:MAG: hypothetical protein ACYC5H_09160 [Methylovirgula sp.]
MKTICLVAIALLASQTAFAANASKPQTSSGASALALAALVAEHSPRVPAQNKKILAAFLAGMSKLPLQNGQKITVTADKIICRAGNVDLTEHACDLVFGKKTVQLHGRGAHELYATLVEIGVPSDGAAGTIFEAVSGLACTIDPKEIASKDGGGASCRFMPSA